jgi:hypothetical protein
LFCIGFEKHIHWKSIMKLSLSVVTLGVVLASVAHGFVTPVPSSTMMSRTTSSSMVLKEAVTMAESGVPPATSESSDVADVEIPTNLPSACGMDYIPLATMLATGDLAEADQVCFSKQQEQQQQKHERRRQQTWTAAPSPPSKKLSARCD